MGKTIVSRGNDPKKYSIHSLKRHLKTHEIIWAELENYLEQRTTPSKKRKLEEDSTTPFNARTRKAKTVISSFKKKGKEGGCIRLGRV